MTEMEKLRAGLDYDLRDEEIRAMKTRALLGCEKLDSISALDTAAREAAIRELFGSVGARPAVYSGFHCDCGGNITVGDDFLANYNVTILDRGPVTIGDHVMIAPGVLITTTGHPLSPRGRREHLGYMKPVTIGSDVWIGGNAVILPGVTIGNNVVVAAGAVVNRDVPDNSLVAGVPARIVKRLENDLSGQEGNEQ